MTIDIEQRDGVCVARLRGELTGGGAGDPPLMDAVGDALDAAGGRIVLDLAGVSYLNSAGLGDLVALTARTNSQGGRVVLAGPTPFVVGVLDTTQLSRFFNVAPSVEKALDMTRA